MRRYVVAAILTVIGATFLGWLLARYIDRSIDLDSEWWQNV